MIKVLVVDDERHIISWLMSLFSSLDSVELDLYSAYSGDQAIEILDRVKIDIVFSDICMPGLSGFELADRIRLNWPSSRIIFLTGYNEFHYAYKAKDYDCVSFLLKTEDDEKIVDALMKAIDSIQQEYHSNLIKSRAAANEQMIAYLQEKEFISELCNRKRPIDDLTRLMYEANLTFDLSMPFYFLIGKQCNLGVDSLDITGIRGLTDIYLSRYLHCCCVKRSEDILWLVQKDQTSRDNSLLSFSSVLETFLTAFHETMNLELFMIWYPKPVYIDKVPETIKRLNEVLRDEMVWTNGEPAVFVFSDEKEREWQFNGSDEIDNSNLDAQLSLLENCLMTSKKEEFIAILTDFRKIFPKNKSMHTLPVLEKYQNLALILVRRLAQLNNSNNEHKLYFDFEKLYSPTDFANWNEAIDYLLTIAQSLFILADNQVKYNSDVLVNKICDFIHQNIQMPMSLDIVSRKFNYNSSYLSRVFHRSTGILISEYINQVKLRNAKELLLRSDLQINDIAKKVGFDSSQYFCTFFKKKEGIAPGEYRLTRRL